MEQRQTNTTRRNNSTFGGGSSFHRNNFRQSYGQGSFRSFGGRNSRFSRNGKSNRFGIKISPEKYIAKADETLEVPSIYGSSYKFSDLDLNESLKRNILKRYEHPTKIQDQAIPHIVSGEDILGLASTGSGKTAAFLIPMINKVLLDRSQRCLTIVPTRDLALQIQEEFTQFACNTGLYSTLVIGGASMGKQIYSMRRNPQFIFATPGRLKDLNQRRVVNLNLFNNVVLDEVDRMLDMGFIEDIKFLISQLGEQRQSMFFSATMSVKAEELANTLLKNPTKVQVEKQSPLRTVDQDIVRFKDNKDKVEKLHDILIQEGVDKVLIFTRTKHGADDLSKELFQRGFKADAIHGDKTQGRRDHIIGDFKRDILKILVATDVASRGLDIKDITHVINYDEPATFEDYIHRIGRTGRIGKKGTALTFVKGN